MEFFIKKKNRTVSSAKLQQRQQQQPDLTLNSFFFSFEDLLDAVEQSTGIPPSSQILMTSYGKIVKEENVKEVVESTGEVRKSYFQPYLS